MAIPKENRQQMINMMYLVLTALLALNVSAEIIQAFKTINMSLENSKKSANVNLMATINAFQAKRAKEPRNDSITKYLNLANQSKLSLDSLLTYVSGLKDQLVERAGGKDKEDPNGILTRKDDMEVSTGYLVEGKNGKDGEAYNLKKKIDQTLISILNLVESNDKDKVKKLITLSTTSAKKGGDWVREQFYQMPAVASFAMLTKLENDIKNTQSSMSQYFFGKVGSSTDLQNGEIIFNRFSANISSPASYVLQGEPYEANISLAATSSKFAEAVSVSLNGQHVPVDPQTGIAHFKTSSTIGEHSINGSIALTDNNTGKIIGTYPFESKYTVAAPFATVSPTKMNVLYIGVDNPIQISAAGVAANNLKVSMANGTINGSGGNYIVNVQTPGETNINISANGKNYGAFKFRVKTVPDPIAMLSKRKSGPFPISEFKIQKGPYAEIENFDFYAPFTISSFSLFYHPKNNGEPAQFTTSGTLFSKEMLAVIQKAKPGDYYYIEDIKAVGPDKRSRSLPSLAFKIK